MALGDLLRSSGLRQSELAEGIGVARETVTRWVAGKHSPASDQAASILRFLNRPENLRRLGRRRPVTFEELFAASPDVPAEATA